MLYQASPIERTRVRKAALELHKAALFESVAEIQPAPFTSAFIKPRCAVCWKRPSRPNAASQHAQVALFGAPYTAHLLQSRRCATAAHTSCFFL